MKNLFILFFFFILFSYLMSPKGIFFSCFFCLIFQRHAGMRTIFFMSWRNKLMKCTRNINYRFSNGIFTTSTIVDTTSPIVFFKKNPRFDFSFFLIACRRAIAKCLLYNRRRSWLYFSVSLGYYVKW